MAAETYDKIDSLSELKAQQGGDLKYWLGELAASDKELEKWRKKARKVVREFRAEHNELSGFGGVERKFNLFASNVQILQTSLLNEIPIPSSGREFGDSMDDVARVAAAIMERALLYQTRKGQYRLYSIFQSVVQDNLVPGVGVSWHTYDAQIVKRVEEPTPEQLEIDPNAQPLEYDDVESEEIVDDYVYWEDLCWSPARVWEEVRWVGRSIYMTKDQLIKRFGKEKADKIGLDHAPKTQSGAVDTQNQIFQQARIYEIWDKTHKKVVWFSKSFQGGLLDEKDDFLKLNDFFPCPRFLVATASTGQFIPIPDHHYAKDQYRELNDINTRISLLVKACRVAGVYDKNSGAIKSLLSNNAENVLIPVDQWAALAEKNGLKGVVDWLPLEQIIKTIEQLIKSREDIKQQIYEVTGMADIIRGASKASETLGAQKLKAQYASMRIQKRQKDVVQYVSTVFSMQAQLIRKHMDANEIAKIAQVQFLEEDPQLVQQALKLIKSEDFDLRVEVESDSLSDIDFQAEKNDRMQFMEVATTFLEKTGGMMTQDPIMGPFLGQLLQFSLAGFKVGKKFEGKLDRTLQQLMKKFAQPQQPQKSPEERKAETEIQIMEREAQLEAKGKEQELVHEKQMQDQKLSAQERKLALDARANEMKAAAQERQMNLDAQKAAMTAMLPPQGGGNGSA